MHAHACMGVGDDSIVRQYILCQHAFEACLMCYTPTWTLAVRGKTAVSSQMLISKRSVCGCVCVFLYSAAKIVDNETVSYQS